MRLKYLSIAFILPLLSFSQIVKKHHILHDDRIGDYQLYTSDGVQVNLCAKTKGLITVNSAGEILFDVYSITSTTCAYVAATPYNPLSPQSPYKKLVFIDQVDKNGTRTFGSPLQVLRVPFWGYTLGLNSLPFRVRGSVEQNGVSIPTTGTTGFQLAVNVGYTRGVSWITRRGVTDWSYTAGVFVGPAVTDLKKETVQDPTTWVGTQTTPTVTYGTSIVLARNNFGVVLAWGFENAVGKNHGEWIYNNRPYFGFGVNTSFMK